MQGRFDSGSNWANHWFVFQTKGTPGITNLPSACCSLVISIHFCFGGFFRIFPLMKMRKENIWGQYEWLWRKWYWFTNTVWRVRRQLWIRRISLRDVSTFSSIITNKSTKKTNYRERTKKTLQTNRKTMQQNKNTIIKENITTMNLPEGCQHIFIHAPFWN